MSRLILAVAALPALVFASLFLGTVHIPPGKVLAVLGWDFQSVDGYIVNGIRLPRVLGALVGGAALAVAGALYQILLRNPLADPYVLGIANAAIFFYGLAFLVGIQVGLPALAGQGVYVSSSVMGAAIVSALLLALSARYGTLYVLLFGVALGFVFGAGTQILIALADVMKVGAFVLATLGTFSGVTWDRLLAMSVACLPALAAALALSLYISPYVLGEEHAAVMGLNVRVARISVIAVASVLTATVIAYVGVVGFVGLVGPHISRLLLGTESPQRLVPTSALTGATVTLAADDMARSLLPPLELPITAVTSLVGVPVLIWLLTRRHVQG